MASVQVTAAEPLNDVPERPVPIVRAFGFTAVIVAEPPSEIEDPLIPDDDEVYKFFCHLAYCQYTKTEMLNGTAWAMLNE